MASNGDADHALTGTARQTIQTDPIPKTAAGHSDDVATAGKRQIIDGVGRELVVCQPRDHGGVINAVRHGRQVDGDAGLFGQGVRLLAQQACWRSRRPR